MLIEKTGTSKYVQGMMSVKVTRVDGKKPNYTIGYGEDKLYDVRESDVVDLFQILYKMMENEEFKTVKPSTLTAR